MELCVSCRKTLAYFKQTMYSSMLHTSIQSNECVSGTPREPSRLLCTTSMSFQLILTWKNLLSPSKFQTLSIYGRPHKKAQWSFPIACTKVLWMRSYAEVLLTLSIMMSMNTNSNNKTQIIFFLYCNLMKTNKKSARVKMSMNKNAN